MPKQQRPQLLMLARSLALLVCLNQNGVVKVIENAIVVVVVAES